MNLTVSGAKILAMFIIGMGSFLTGLFPACFTHRKGEQKLLTSLSLCFGAGVLLATSLLHMLPETREYLPADAELVFCCGFLLLYMVDEIVHFVWSKVIDESPSHPPSHSPSTSDRIDFIHNRRNNSTFMAHGCGHSHTNNVGNTSNQHYQFDGHHSNSSCVGRTSHDEISDRTYEPNLKSNIPYVQNNRYPCYGAIPEDNPSAPNASMSCCDETETLLCHSTHAEPCANTRTNLAGLLLALTFHSVLEGLAVGLQTETSKVLLLIVAVASHKLAISVCLGVEMATASDSFLRHAIAITVFAGGSAAGIGIGMIVTHIKKNWVTDILMPVLHGIAGGSLFYATVSEILPRERARWHKTTRRVAGITQFFSVTFGFIFIFILNKYVAKEK